MTPADNAPERAKIYRCGWCGFPVDRDGSQLHGVGTTAEANEWLAAHADCREVLVNGFCCPGGDGSEAWGSECR